jgi:hypothetical protein
MFGGVHALIGSKAGGVTIDTPHIRARLLFVDTQNAL